MAKHESRDIGLDETMLAPATVDPPRPPTPARLPKRAPLWPFILLALLVIAAGVGLAIWAWRDGDPRPTIAAPSTTPADATMPTIPTDATSIEELLVLERSAIARADEASLAILIAPDAFAFGVDHTQIAIGGPAIAGMLHAMLGKRQVSVTSTSARIAREGDAAWIVDDLEIDGKKLMTSQLAFNARGIWRVAAWHWAELVPDPVAYKLAKAGKLPQPEAIADHPDDDQQVIDAMRAMFASRQAFIDGYSERADAIDIGSAPRQLVVGGPAVKRAFRGIKAEFRVHDGVHVGRIGDRVGWGVANVDFSMVIDDEPATQTFRVLAVLVRERGGWKLVHAQWSNAGPL